MIRVRAMMRSSNSVMFSDGDVLTPTMRTVMITVGEADDCHL